MKFAICLLLSGLSLVNAYTESLGNTNTHVLGTHIVEAQMSDFKHTVHQFTYPETPSKYPIVGMKLIDYRPKTHVEFIKGHIGDYQRHHQVTIKVTAEGHDIHAHFVFFVEHKD